MSEVQIKLQKKESKFNYIYYDLRNSLIIFTINVKELKERSMKGLLIVLYLYKKLFIYQFSYYSNIDLSQ